jgi:N-acylneuraminate cytidylyltransferase
MLWACVTSPLIDHDDYNEIIKKYYESQAAGFDSIIAVTEFKHYILESKGPLNYKLGEGHSNSQDLPSLDLFTNGALICPVSKVIEWGYNYGPNHFRYRIPQSKSIDIDTKWDYISAKAFYMEILNEKNNASK